MRGWKRTVQAAAIVAAAYFAVVLYLDFNSFYRARRADMSPEAKVAELGPANRRWPVLDQTLADEGRAHLDLAIDALPDVDSARMSLKRAERLLRRALRRNPASAANHLVYARTLRYLGFLSEAAVPDSLAELWKAALLAGKRTVLDYELSRELLQQWPNLDGTQREWTLGLVREVLGRENIGQFLTILQSWDLNVGDAALLEATLPDSSRLHRAYAAFLGEKSQSLETRQRLLARAEVIDYNQAVRKYDEGDPDICLRLLDGIRYYGGLAEGVDIAPDFLKHEQLRKDALLSRAKARLLRSRRLEDAESDLRAYLAMEDEYNKVLELETFLKEVNVLKEESVARPAFQDLRRLVFEMFLMFRLNKYSRITALGAVVQNGVFVLEKAQKPSLREIYTLIADSYDKLNFIYEPETLYRKALEIEPGSWEVLFKLRYYYERLNEQGKAAEVGRELARVLTPPAVAFAEGPIAKGRSRVMDLKLEPGATRLRLTFENWEEGGPPPLVSVVFRGRVVWEGFLAGTELSVDVDAAAGSNRLEIGPVNRPARILGLLLERIGE